MAERWGRWLFWLKISSAQSFCFCNSNMTTFPTSRNEKFQFLALHCPSRNAISSKVFNEFSKNFFWLKDEESCYCAWKFQVHSHFAFAIATLPLFQHPENEKFQFFPLHCPSRNAITSKVFNEFSKKIFLAERRGRWLSTLKILGAQIFWIGNSNVTTFPISRKCKNFNFSLFRCPSRNSISSKVFN